MQDSSETVRCKTSDCNEHALAVQSQGNLGQGSLLISTEVIVRMEEGVGGGSIVMVG